MRYIRSAGLLLLVLCFASCATQTRDFSQWLEEFKKEAAAQGISQQVLSDAFDNIDEPDQDIIKIDRKQAQKTHNFPSYAKGLVTQKRIDAAREAWQANRELFNRLEATYGVPAPILLALWGIESNFGERQGEHSIVLALTTLAYDNRRSQMFRKQLIAALQILQQEHMRSEDLTGSWAGAMGQIQFMPMSYLAYAVDFDGDGKKDIWQNEGDALASMANYLKQKGWTPATGWGLQVSLPDRKDIDWPTLKGDRPMQEWQNAGVRRSDGTSLPETDAMAHLVLPDDDPAVAYLVYPNYNVIMDWNHSTYFATTVGLLADAIGSP